MDRRVLLAILLSALLIGLTFLTFEIFRPFLLSILWATALATVTYKPYSRLRERLRGHGTLAAMVMTLAVLVVIITPVFVLSFIFLRDAAAVYTEISSGNFSETITKVEGNWLVRKAIHWGEQIGGKPIHLDEVINELMRRLDPAMAARAAQNIGTVLFGFLAGLLFTLFSVFYMYRDGPQAVRALRELIPMSETDRETILHDVEAAMNASIRGGLLTAVCQGCLGFVILMILGVPQPVLWSAAMAVASVVPVVGTSLVWMPIAGILAIDGHVWKALALFTYGTLVIGMSDNFVRPLIVGRHMEVHPLILFFGILGGIATFGFAGVILGPIAVAFLNVTTRLLRREFRTEHEET